MLPIAFQPLDGATKNITAAAGSANILLVTGTGQNRIQVRVVNAGTAVAFVRFGKDNTVTASNAADVPVAIGGTAVFSVCIPDSGTLYAAAVGTGAVYFTPGTGLS